MIVLFGDLDCIWIDDVGLVDEVVCVVVWVFELEYVFRFDVL